MPKLSKEIFKISIEKIMVLNLSKNQILNFTFAYIFKMRKKSLVTLYQT